MFIIIIIAFFLLNIMREVFPIPNIQGLALVFTLYLIIEHLLPVPSRHPGVTTQTGQYPGDDPGEVLHTLDGGDGVDHLVNVSLLPEIEQ